MARVLVTEEIAEPGLAVLRAAGHDVDVSVGLSATELLTAVEAASVFRVTDAPEPITA